MRCSSARPPESRPANPATLTSATVYSQLTDYPVAPVSGTTNVAHRPMRVLFVCQHDLGGPTEKQALGFAQGLLRRGHAVAFTFGADTGGDDARGAALVDRMRFFEHRLQGCT